MSNEEQNLSDNSIWQTIEGNYHFFDTPVLEYITSFIKQNCEGVIECGVGSGRLIDLLRRRGYIHTYIGTDYTDALLKMARTNNPSETFYKFNLLHDDFSTFLPSNAYDCAVAIDVFDNVYPYKHGLEQMRFIAKKYVILTLWQGFLEQDSIRFTEEGGWNVNTYSKDNWYKTLDEVGFKIIVDAEVNQYVPELGKLFYQHLFILDVCK